MSKTKSKAVVLTNMILGSSMSFEDIMKAYFSNDGDTILRNVAMTAKDPEVMFHTLEQIDYEISNENVLSQKSNFGDLQRKVVNQMINEENISFLETNIVNDPREIDEESCPNLLSAKEEIKKYKESTLTDSFSMSKVA